MKATISNTNSKGQLVIPKSIRDKLNINEDVNLDIRLVDQAIVIKPIMGIVTQTGTDSTYLETLNKTKGQWGESSVTDQKNQKAEEAQTQRNKSAW